MDYLSLIKKPITNELSDFIELFNKSLEGEDGLLTMALHQILKRGGKRMRPMLVLLIAKAFGTVTDITQHAAIALELLHTASLVHDDVIDESSERRGQASVNASFNNKVAVLVGDYILSTSLQQVSFTHSDTIVRQLAELGQTLSNGEILQLSSISNEEISEEVYFDVIERKTASLFETCAAVGALSVGAESRVVEDAQIFGRSIGLIFQIRDDIFDYFSDEKIGKPTGNDMAEGKLTLPVIHVLLTTQEPTMLAIARKVKALNATPDEIAQLVEFTKVNGGIEYAEEKMREIHSEARGFITGYIKDRELQDALTAYLDYIIARNV